MFSPFVLVFALVWGLWPDLIITYSTSYRFPILLSGVVLAGGPLVVNLAVQYLRRQGTGDPAIVVILLFALSLVGAISMATNVGSAGLSILLSQKTDAVREQSAMSFLQMTKQLGSTGFLALLALPLVLYRI